MDIQISQFHNENTLNIFSDASIIGRRGEFTGCYGAVAVVKDDIIDQNYRIVSYTTNNNSEIKGIRSAIDIAIKYKDIYPFINIFSDSQVSINGLRSYIYGWRINPNDGLLYTKMKKRVSNQEIFVEAGKILDRIVFDFCMTVIIIRRVLNRPASGKADLAIKALLIDALYRVDKPLVLHWRVILRLYLIVVVPIAAVVFISLKNIRQIVGTFGVGILCVQLGLAVGDTGLPSALRNRLHISHSIWRSSHSKSTNS